VPAGLVIIMAIVAVSSAATLTPVVVSWAVAMFVVLALLLGSREAWMQRDCRELTARLQEIAAQLPAVAPRSSDVRLAEAITQFHRHVVSHRAPPQVPPGRADALMDERDGSHAHERSVQLLATQLQHYLHVRAAQFQRRIERNQLHMSAVIDDVLRYYSRCESLETRLMTVDVSSLVAQTVSSLQRDIGSIDFQVQFEREPFLLHSPAGELSMVLILRELLHNAWKFTRTVATPTVSIECVRECGQVVLTVRDNGIGFDMRHQSRLFQPFQWLHVAPGCRGVGLGLALASRAVQRMGGTVRVSQQSCAGACFVVELPDFAALSTQRPLQRSIVHGGALRGYR
jgi:signal transduction histidine kinase